MTASELMGLLSKKPPDTKVFVPHDNAFWWAGINVVVPVKPVDGQAGVLLSYFARTEYTEYMPDDIEAYADATFGAPIWVDPEDDT